MRFLSESALWARINGLTIFLVIIGVVSVGSSLKASHDTSSTNDRLCDYVRENARVSKVRSMATAERDAAIGAFLGGAGELGAKGAAPSPFTALSQAYLVASDDLASARARNPLPEPPDDC